MSHFVFGLVDLEVDEISAESRVRVSMTLENCATGAGLVLLLEAKGEPEILATMRPPFSNDSAIPFLCLAHSEDDTSDGVISPYQLGIEGARDGATRLGHWVGCVLRDEHIVRVRLWLTEGYDDSFERYEIGASELTPLVLARLNADLEIPSLFFSVLRDDDTKGPHNPGQVAAR